MIEKTITELQKEIHSNAINKGFWEDHINIPTKLMLIVSEVAEAMEADRMDKRFIRNIDAVNGWVSDEDFIQHFEISCKDTFEDELADAVIRIFDLAEKLEIPLYKHIIAKMRYNKKRENKHGKKY